LLIVHSEANIPDLIEILPPTFFHVSSLSPGYAVIALIIDIYATLNS